MISSAVMLGQIMNLRMAVMARSYAVCGAGILYLLVFQFSIGASCFRHTRLEKASPASAAVVVRSVRRHINKVLFAHNGFNGISQILGNWISETLSHKLAGVLNRKLYLQILIPVRIDLEFSFPDPLGIILNDALNFKIEGDVEFFQSGPDCKKFVPSLRIEPDFAFQIIHSFSLNFDNVFP